MGSVSAITAASGQAFAARHRDLKVAAVVGLERADRVFSGKASAVDAADAVGGELLRQRMDWTAEQQLAKAAMNLDIIAGCLRAFDVGGRDPARDAAVFDLDP